MIKTDFFHEYQADIRISLIILNMQALKKAPKKESNEEGLYSFFYNAD